MSYTKVSSFPSFFNELKNLESLSIAHTNIISLPSFFDELTQLRWMDISGTGITDLPYGVRSMNIVIVGRPE
jgi:Leucine-rich repeat (LRR) protein